MFFFSRFLADSASSTFIKSLNRRISTTGSELNFLDSMSFGTVSFEELLGHCNQIYKNNQDELVNLQDRLTAFGYVPGTLILFRFESWDFERLKCSDFRSFSYRFYVYLDLEIEIDEGRDDEESDVGAFGHEYSKHSDDDFEPHSLQRSFIKGLDEDDLYPFWTFWWEIRIFWQLLIGSDFSFVLVSGRLMLSTRQ